MEYKILIPALTLFTLPFSAEAQKLKNVEVIEPEYGETGLPDDSKTIKRKVAIGRFSNETQYAKGLFYDKENDPMGKQALDILSAKLAASEKFLLLERNDLSTILQELNNHDENTGNKIGADYMIIGSITEYGRKNVGDQKLFSSTKSQIVEAGVSLRIVDVSTGLIIYSSEAKGEAELTTKTTVGLGGRSDFDATLSDKAISAAIDKLVENVINKCTDKPWRSYILASDHEATIISGGTSQGIAEGDRFAIMSKGKKVKNPQTGITIELPGKKIGEVEVIMCGGDTPETEYSIVSVADGKINGNELNNYIIEEIK